MPSEGKHFLAHNKPAIAHAQCIPTFKEGILFPNLSGNLGNK